MNNADFSKGTPKNPICSLSCTARSSALAPTGKWTGVGADEGGSIEKTRACRCSPDFPPGSNHRQRSGTTELGRMRGGCSCLQFGGKKSCSNAGHAPVQAAKPTANRAIFEAEYDFRDARKGGDGFRSKYRDDSTVLQHSEMLSITSKHRSSRDGCREAHQFGPHWHMIRLT